MIPMVDYSLDDYVYSVDDISEMFDVHKTSISLYIKRGVISPECYTKIKYSGEKNRRIYFNSKAIDALRNYMTPPEGWLTVNDIAERLQTTSANAKRILYSVYGFSNYRRKCRTEYYYDPAILDKLGNLTRRVYVTLQKPVPDQEWFTPEEFADLFGKRRISAETWILSGRIPAELVQQKAKYYKIKINRLAIEYVDGKAYDNFNGTRKDLKLEPDNDEPIELDDCILTPSEHKRRLKIFYDKFNQISPAAVAWLASLGLTADDLTD